MKKIKINHLDLFSGIGGFHLGFEKAGFEVTSYFSEIDKYAIDNYKNNFKNSKYVGSVTDVRETQLPKIDAITFGSPCQDFSLAGKRKGMEGDRSSLITEAIRLIDECRPRFFIWENVKGTFSSNNGEDFWAIIQAFTNIGGYRLEWQLLNTKWFLPQNRERIYLVGYLGDGSRGQVFPIGKGFEKDDNKIKDGDCPTIPARAREDGSGQPIIKINSATKKGYEEAAEGDSINYSNPNSKTRRGRVGKGVAQTLDTACNQAIIGAMRGRYNEENKTEQQIEINKKGTSNTLTAVTKDNLVINDKIRRLTPIECERLQGFPDNWTQYGKSGKISDTQRYKMCGNAVTVDVVESVAKSIINTIY
jgi:DNA (cytosine-5)-methyltransferase 1